MAITKLTEASMLIHNQQIQAGNKINADEELTRYSNIIAFSDQVSAQAVTVGDVQTITAAKTFSGGINMNNAKITNLGGGTQETDAVNLGQLNNRLNFNYVFLEKKTTPIPFNDFIDDYGPVLFEKESFLILVAEVAEGQDERNHYEAYIGTTSPPNQLVGALTVYSYAFNRGGDMMQIFVPRNHYVLVRARGYHSAVYSDNTTRTYYKIELR